MSSGGYRQVVVGDGGVGVRQDVGSESTAADEVDKGWDEVP